MVFEHFDERARECVVLAQEEAFRLGHEELGTVHLLLGVAHVARPLLAVEVEALRAAVVALHGSGRPSSGGQIPISAEAKAALEGANAQALGLGHTVIEPAHLLLALLDAGGGGARALREAGAIPSEVRERATAAAGGGPRPRPGGVAAIAPESLCDPAVEAHLLRLILVNDGPAARLLRSHGIDEARLREALGPPGEGC